MTTSADEKGKGGEESCNPVVANTSQIKSADDAQNVVGAAQSSSTEAPPNDTSTEKDHEKQVKLKAQIEVLKNALLEHADKSIHASNGVPCSVDEEPQTEDEKSPEKNASEDTDDSAVSREEKPEKPLEEASGGAVQEQTILNPAHQRKDQKKVQFEKTKKSSEINKENEPKEKDNTPPTLEIWAEPSEHPQSTPSSTFKDKKEISEEDATLPYLLSSNKAAQNHGDEKQTPQLIKGDDFKNAEEKPSFQPIMVSPGKAEKTEEQAGERLPANKSEEAEGASPAEEGEPEEAEGASPAEEGEPEEAEGVSPAEEGESEEAEGVSPAEEGESEEAEETSEQNMNSLLSQQTVSPKSKDQEGNSCDTDLHQERGAAISSVSSKGDQGKPDENQPRLYVEEGEKSVSPIEIAPLTSEEKQALPTQKVSPLIAEPKVRKALLPLKGNLRRGRSGLMLTIQWITGLALFKWFGYIVLTLLGYRHPVTLELTAEGLVLRGERRIMGIPIGSTSWIIPRKAVQSIRLIGASSLWIAICSVLVLVVASMIGTTFIMWGVHGQTPSWILVGLCIVGLGVVLDAMAVLLIRFNQKRSIAHLEIRTEMARFHMAKVSMKTAEAFIKKLTH